MECRSGMSEPLSPKQGEEHDEDHDDDSKPQCRICWEKAAQGAMLSPCLCAGTQKHVHLKCLRRWQDNVQKHDESDERAFRCSVCRALFSVPPNGRRRGAATALQALRGLGGALCITLLACGLSGPPWPHLALLVLLLFGSRWHWLPGLALLLTASTLAGLHTQGLRLALRVDPGGRLGVALIRFGAPVPGIGPGTLLVASEGLDHSPIFRRSVVLLTQHARGGGARGVILTQPMVHPPALPADLTSAGAAGSAGSHGAGAGGSAGPGQRARGGGAAAGGAASAQLGSVPLKHFFGGPVGMPGEGVNHEMTVLHFVPSVEGSHQILPTANRTTGLPASGGAASGDASAAAAAAAASRGRVQLFEGGGLGDILRQAGEASAAAAAAAAAQPRRVRRAGGHGQQQGEAAAVPAPVLLFHGACAWAEGQLEGELRAGSWGFTAGTASDLQPLLEFPQDQLWHIMDASPALQRVR